MVRRCCSLFVIVLAAAAFGQPLAFPQPVPNELPRAWSLEDIEAATPNAKKGKCYTLAWRIVQDDRPLRIETCLVLLALDHKSEHGQYYLAKLYRHPASERPQWAVSKSRFIFRGDNNIPQGQWRLHEKWFINKPTNKDIYAFCGMDDVGWPFTLEDGYEYISCSVCEANWIAAIGQKPSRFFGVKAP